MSQQPACFSRTAATITAAPLLPLLLPLLLLLLLLVLLLVLLVLLPLLLLLVLLQHLLGPGMDRPDMLSGGSIRRCGANRLELE